MFGPFSSYQVIDLMHFCRPRPWAPSPRMRNVDLEFPAVPVHHLRNAGWDSN